MISLYGHLACSDEGDFSGTPKDLRARRASVLVTKRKERESEKSSEKSQLKLCLLKEKFGTKVTEPEASTARTGERKC